MENWSKEREKQAYRDALAYFKSTEAWAVCEVSYAMCPVLIWKSGLVGWGRDTSHYLDRMEKYFPEFCKMQPKVLYDVYGVELKWSEVEGAYVDKWGCVVGNPYWFPLNDLQSRINLLEQLAK